MAKLQIHGALKAASFVLLAAMLSPAMQAEPKGSPPRFAPSAIAQADALTSIKNAKTPLQKKIDSRLYLGMLHRRNDSRLAPLTSFRFVKPDADGRVAVEILMNGVGGLKPVVNTVESLGGSVLSGSHARFAIRARVHLEDLETLASISTVRRVRVPFPAMTSVVNVSEGDKTHGADEARGFFGVNGTGVKIGVLSDGVDSLVALQTSGDLPAVQVLPGQAGSGDEGSAMLEIVHDLAPGAALAFATAFTDEATFAQNILDLATAGCNVIVDDVIYFDESPFQDGPVAQAVNTVTAAGVLYFSSAGNEGNVDDSTAGTWEGDFLPNGTPPVLAGAGPVHNFGDGGQSILVTNAGGNPPLLIWAEDYDLTTGNASTDFDLYDLDGGLTTIFDASTDTQDGIGGDDFPIEFIGGGTFTGERLVVAKFAAGTTSSVPEFNLIVFRGVLDGTLTTSGATRGHSAAADAFSTAATPAAASFDGVTPPGPYPGLFTGANATESFTSDGPRRILLNTDGSEITPGNRTSTGGTVRQKPDLTAADGVSCAAPGFNPFYGTSAAAPHAAAIAGLVKSAVPALTPAQIRTALLTTAIDIEAAGTDRDTGAGIVMAHAALLGAGAVPGAFLAAGAPVPTQVLGDGDPYIESNEIWDLSVPLTNNGGDIASAISAVLTTSTAGVTISSANSSYPDLAASATGSNDTPFRFALSDTFACGTAIPFTLTVTYSGGVSPQTFDFNLLTGAPGTPVTFSFTGPPVPIPDGLDLTGNNPGAPVFASLPVSGVGANVAKVVVSIDGTLCSNVAGSTTVGLDHTYVNDLRITLHSPAGTAITVISNTDGSGNNFCQTVLDDSGLTSIQSVVTADAPFTGVFSPNLPLSGFNGEAADGTWQLEAQDFFLQDTGNIRAFSVTITPAVCDVAPLSPQSMAVDAHVTTGDNSNHNGVLEPDETVQVSPAWKDTSAATPETFTGTATSLDGALTADDSKADYGTILAGATNDCFLATADCYLMTVAGPRPTQHWDVTFSEALSVGLTQTWTLHVGNSFGDVSATDIFYPSIEAIFHHQVTAGCLLGDTFCPLQNNLRQEMAVFLLKASQGSGYVPPACVPPGIFTDVACPGLYTDWIEDLKTRNITAGCGDGTTYCPTANILRQEMAVLLLKTLLGSGYTPPACTPPGIFSDVLCPGLYTDFIEDLYTRGITGGCQVNPNPLAFCPTNPVTRQEMAAFLRITFSLLLYGP